MLGNANFGVALAVKDMEEAKKFYMETLGLEFVAEFPGGMELKSGQTKLLVYPSQYAGTNQATYGGWTVQDVDAEVEELKSKGVSFEHYDMPGVTLEGDVHVAEGMRTAWFKDPSGNILAINNEM